MFQIWKEINLFYKILFIVSIWNAHAEIVVSEMYHFQFHTGAYFLYCIVETFVVVFFIALFVDIFSDI